MDSSQRSGERPGQAPAPSAPVASHAPAGPHHPPLWLQRTYLTIYVAFCLWMGMVLVILPWSPLWDHNSLLAFPALRSLLASDFVRGLISGVGLVDIWLGVSEALHYHEHKPE